MWSNPQFHGDLVTFTEEILIGKLRYLCSVRCFLKGMLLGHILIDFLVSIRDLKYCL